MTTVHVYPIEDWIEHDTESSADECKCICNPKIEYIDPETDLPFPNPIVIHNAVDGRE